MAEYNFDIKAGATFRKTFRFADVNNVPLNFTGYKFRAQLRRSKSSETFFDFRCVYADENGIAQLPSAGIVTMIMDADVSSLIPCGNLLTDSRSLYKWSLEKYLDVPGNIDVDRVLEGEIRISAEVNKGSING